LACPICNQRKPKRFCPAKAASICTICCGTEREVSIDCPADCEYLIASRRYERENPKIDPAHLPFPEFRMSEGFVTSHERLILAISFAIASFARLNRMLVDSDALAALTALADSYRTLSTGIIYEQAPDYRLQRELYEAVKKGIADFRQSANQGLNATTVRDSDVRDTLMFLTQLGATHTNHRLKGRAYLDFLAAQFPPENLPRPGSNLLVIS
jgi:hypothetical protein